MKKTFLSPVAAFILALFFYASTLSAQSFTIRATYTCTGARVAVNYYIDAPGILNDSGTTSASGDVNWTITSGDPAGNYVITLEPAIGTQAPVSYTMTKGGSSVNAFFTVATPGLANFSINGVAAGNPPLGGVINLYKCGSSSTVSLTNTSVRASFIGKYRFTVYNSNSSGTQGTQVSQTAWLTSFPTSLTLPTPSGQYLLVRMETQNTCGTTSTNFKDAWIRWFSGSAPASYQVKSVNDACSNLVSYVNNNTNPANPTLMRPFTGGVIDKLGSNFSQYRVVIQECNTSGTLIGSPVADATFTNTSGYDITAKNFSDMFGGLPIWMSGFTDPWVNEYSSKNWRMSLYFNSPGCGWTTTPVIHYFKINTSCTPWYALPAPENDLLEIVASETLRTHSGSKVKERSAETSIYNVRVAPNPASDIVRFELPEMADMEASVVLFDATGKIVLAEKQALQGAQAAIDVARLAPGLYFFRWEANGQQAQGKFIKE